MTTAELKNVFYRSKVKDSFAKLAFSQALNFLKILNEKFNSILDQKLNDLNLLFLIFSIQKQLV